MTRQYLLPRPSEPPTAASLRAPLQGQPLKLTHPAVRAMQDLQREPLPAVSEEAALEQILDALFRHGARALVVERDQSVVGLITTEHVRGQPGARRAADVMQPVASVPAVDWQTIRQSRIRDLMELFDGSGASHLLVLEDESPTRTRVRGLIHRDRLARQLGPRWTTRIAVTALPVGI